MSDDFKAGMLKAADIADREARRLYADAVSARKEGLEVTSNLLFGKRDTADRIASDIRATHRQLPPPAQDKVVVPRVAQEGGLTDERLTAMLQITGVESTYPPVAWSFWAATELLKYRRAAKEQS